jgi:hypothetical protein
MKVKGGSFSTHPNGLDARSCMRIRTVLYAYQSNTLTLIFKNMDEIIKAKYINPSEDNMHWEYGSILDIMSHIHTC